MLNTLKNILQKRGVKVLLPVLGIFIIAFLEYVIDVLSGDGDGQISNQYVKSVIAFIDLFLILFSIFLLLTLFFKLENKVIIVNFVFVFVILYSFEFLLQRKDPFFKESFDSNYYKSNYFKYYNFLKPALEYNKGTLTWGHLVRKNKLNYRDKDFEIPKPDSLFRIMVLGDSFTWGAGLGEHERYSNRLDSLLKIEFPNKNIEVVNFGRSASSTIQEKDSLLKHIDNVNPNLIVVGFCSNDLQPICEGYSKELDKFTQRWSGLEQKIRINFSAIRINYLGNFLANGIYKLGEKFGSLPTYTEAENRCYDKTSENWKIFGSALKQIYSTSEKHHCLKPIFCSFISMNAIKFPNQKLPQKEEADLQIRKSWYKQVGAEANDIGFTAIDYEKEIEVNVANKTITENNVAVSPLDGHPSKELNVIYAQELFKQVKQQLKNYYENQKQITN